MKIIRQNQLSCFYHVVTELVAIDQFYSEKQKQYGDQDCLYICLHILCWQVNNDNKAVLGTYRQAVIQLDDDHGKFHEDSCTNVCARAVNTRACFIAIARIYDSCARICARIFMTFLLVVNYYLVRLSFKCQADLCINARARVVNAHTRDKTRAREFTTSARAFVQESL